MREQVGGEKKTKHHKIPEKIKQDMIKSELVKIIHIYQKCGKGILVSSTLISNNCAARTLVAQAQMLRGFLLEFFVCFNKNNKSSSLDPNILEC